MTGGWTGESLFGAFVAILTLGFQQWRLHEATKKERNADSAKIADAIEERDKKLHLILGEYPPHAHTEYKGEVLTADGIRYPNAKFNGH